MRKEIYNEYALSGRLNQIINGISGAVDPQGDIKKFYQYVYDINQAQGFGLDTWGAILDVPRYLEVKPKEGEPYVVKLNDDLYRLTLQLRCITNLTNCSCESIDTMIANVFAGRGKVFTLEEGVMKLRYVFSFLLSDLELALFYNLKILPRPAGVGLTIYELPQYNIFGFNGSGLSGFNVGTFFQGGIV